MKDNRGFTLIELIAAITILSIIMLVAIPNIMSISIKNKNRTYLNDANKLVVLTKYLFESDADIQKPTVNGTSSKCLRVRLSELDQTELQTGPENGTYEENDSLVIVRYDNTASKYVYYVQLKEKYSSGSGVDSYQGVPLTEYKNILGQEKNNFVKTSGWSENISSCTEYIDYSYINN